ncbi:MAG TPA: RnfH family protein, partial [Duganella sp.]
MAADLINVQVCYASDAVQFLRALQVPLGTTLEQAIAASGVLDDVP